MPSLKMHKYIIANCSGGLCNRIRCLISSMRLAEKLSKPLILFWPVNPGCACQFSDLFENQITQITQEELQLLMQKNNFNQIYKFYDDWRLLSFPEDGLKRNFSQAFYSEKGNNIDFEYHRISLSVRENILKYFNRLIPKKFITEKVTQFCSKFDDNTISVHIRSWQEAKNMSKNMSKFFDIRNVYKVMDREKQGTFFVISDSAKILEQVKNRYKERILDYPRTVSPGDRGTTEGIQDAFIELLLLANCMSNATTSSIPFISSQSLMSLPAAAQARRPVWRLFVSLH